MQMLLSCLVVKTAHMNEFNEFFIKGMGMTPRRPRRSTLMRVNMASVRILIMISFILES